MGRSAIFRWLILLSCSSAAMIAIYTNTSEQRMVTYTLHSTSDYGFIRNSMFNFSSCQDILRTTNSSAENTTEVLLRSPCIQYNETPHSQQTKYQLLDSEQRLDFHCKQCALVFSSGHLTGSNMGREIDKTECVIRLNTATVRRHTNDVGMRTTVRVIGHRNIERGLLSMNPAASEILKSSVTRPKIIYVPWLFMDSINRTTNEVYKKARRYSKLFPKVKFYFQNDGMIADMEEMFLNETGLNRTEIETWFSTGLMAVLFALDTCDQVICYGISDADYCRREPTSQVGYHYFESHKDRLRECSYINISESKIKGGHKFLTEKKLYAKWAHYRDITFRAPTWPMSAFNMSDKFESPYLDIYRHAKENGTFDSYVINKPVAVNKSKPLSSDKVRRPILRSFHVARRNIRIGQQRKIIKPKVRGHT